MAAAQITGDASSATIVCTDGTNTIFPSTTVATGNNQGNVEKSFNVDVITNKLVFNLTGSTWCALTEMYLTAGKFITIKV